VAGGAGTEWPELTRVERAEITDLLLFKGGAEKQRKALLRSSASP
jgi:hypothetical protein